MTMETGAVAPVFFVLRWPSAAFATLAVPLMP